MNVRIKNTSPHPLPAYQTLGAAGMDICANLSSPVILHPFERTLIPTGIYMELPQGVEAQIRPRSGLAIKKGLTCLNTPGTIDSDYRGEIQVILINLSNEVQTIEHGDRIAQMVIARYEQIQWEPTEQLDTTERGQGGFGSTDITL